MHLSKIYAIKETEQMTMRVFPLPLFKWLPVLPGQAPISLLHIYHSPEYRCYQAKCVVTSDIYYMPYIFSIICLLGQIIDFLGAGHAF